MKKIWRFFKKIITVNCICLGVFIVANIGIYIYCLVASGPSINQSQSYYLYDNKKNMLFNDSDQWININNVSDNLIKATIDTEDKYFYYHWGLDYFRIVKAIIVNIKSGSLSEGASTITQQYARNLFLNYDKTWSRKIDEAMLAFKLEAHYSKEEILEGYLNTINYGGVYGIENASYHYFGHSASSLSLAEASMLAGIPQSPSNYSPFVDEDLAKKRQKIVLNSMVNNGDISEKEALDAYNVKLVYNDSDVTKYYDNLLYFRDAVIEELHNIDSIPDSLLETGGLKIYTTLDNKAQNSLEQAVDEHMNDADSELQVGGIMIDPKDGGVLALIGGVDYNSSVFNRATDSVRQVGSTMKPFLYYAALENGFTSASSFISEKTTFSFSNGNTYTPKNYNDTYANKAISMGAAISYSDNIYAVKTNLFLGEDMLVNTAKKLGIKNNLSAIPSLALGTEEISLVDMVNAYSIFASMGYKNTAHFIDKIEDKNGNVLYSFDDYREQILDKSLCFILSEMLTYTYDSSFIDYNYPTVISLLPNITNKYSIKTGTTNTDLWIIGYNKNAVLGIWTGFDDNRKISSSDNGYHKKIWIDTMENYLDDSDNKWYDVPDDVVGVLVDPITGILSKEGDKNAKIFYFIKGTEPKNEISNDLEAVWKEKEELLEN